MSVQVCLYVCMCGVAQEQTTLAVVSQMPAILRYETGTLTDWELAE